MRTQNYQAEMISQLSPTNPMVEQRLQIYHQKAQSYTLDPALENNQATRNLQQSILKEAQVRAYNDVIFF